MSFITLPSGRSTYVGRRGRVSASLAAPPAAPMAEPWDATVKRTLNASPLALPAPVPLRILSTPGARQLYRASGYIVGWTARETSGSSAAVANLWDGESTSGQLVAAIGLVAGGTSNLTMPAPGWTVESGLYLDVASGAFDGVVWFLPTGPEVPANSGNGGSAAPVAT